MEPSVNIKAVKNLTPEEQDEVYRLLSVVYEADISTWTWSQDDWRVWVQVDHRIVAHVAITERTCLVNRQPVKVGGIGGVGTHPDWRKQGLASLAMQKTADFLVHQLKADFGVLFCANEMVPYYQRLGWRMIDSPVYFEEEGEKMLCDCPVMYLPGTQPYWPWGEVEIGGRLW
jgi:aminoglycoside 2'-N-acetyltransferase I